MVWVTDDGLEKACISRPGQLLHYSRDRRASTDVDLYDTWLLVIIQTTIRESDTLPTELRYPNDI